ncbi:MAG TPA: hypothetical protein VLZ74_15090 [Methylocella sp.]|nr:hypothetical protein [Methylocella sp.]
MVGFALSSFSTIYGILLGLIAVASYQNFAAVTELVTKEASTLAALYRDLSGYPQPIRGSLEGKLREYTRRVIEESWPLQRRGIAGGSEQVSTFYDELLAYNPTKRKEAIVHSEALRQFNKLLELQRTRLANVTTGIPAIVWWVVAIGALLNIILVWMLDMEVHVHVVLGGVLSLFLGIVIFLIAAMDNPFRGEVSVGPEPIQVVFETLMRPRRT